MAIPVGAIFSGVAKATAGGARAAAGAAMGGAKEAARGAVRGAVKRAVGGGKKMKSPLYGTIKAVKGGSPETAAGGGGGSIVPIGSSIVPVPRSESSIVPASGGTTSIIDQLRSINSTLQQILEVERKEKEKLEDTILDFVRRDEKQRREDEQEKQERKKGKGRKKQSPMVTAAKKAVGGIWDFIMGLVGDFIKYKILDWLGDPKNRKNVQRIVEFIQGLVGFLNGLWKHVIAPLGGLVFTQLFNTLKLFGAIITPIIDLFTFKWLTNPKEFIDGIVNIPKTFIGAMKDSADALINALTFGLFDNIGSLVDSIIKNFNPFSIFGGGEDKEEKVQTPTEGLKQEAPVKEEGSNQEAPAKDVPKLERGGIVGKQKESANPTVQPLSKLVEESKLSSMVTEGILPFMDMMTAPFKIIGTAIVGLILKTVSKIPFVGELIEPIIKMSASAFGVPSEVLTQLQVGTKKEKEDTNKLDEEKVAKEMLSGVKDIQEAKEDESFGSKLSSGFKSIIGGVGNILGAVFTPPAGAATIPPGSGLTPSGAPSPGPDGGIQLGATMRQGETIQEQSQTDRGGFIQGGSGLGSEGGQNTTQGYATHFHLTPPSNDAAGWSENRSVAHRAASILLSTGHKIYFGNLKKFATTSNLANEIAAEQKAHTQPGRTQGGIDMQVTNNKGSMQVKFPLKVTNMGGGIGGGYGRTARVVGTNVELAHGAKGSANSIESSVAKASPPSPTITPAGSKTGPALTQAQGQSNALASQPAAAKPQMSLFDGGLNSTSVIDETSTQSTLGLTLPSSGLWATYRTNL